MKNKKALGLLLSISLVFAAPLPGTMAASADGNFTDGTGEIKEEIKKELENKEIIGLIAPDVTITDGEAAQPTVTPTPEAAPTDTPAPVTPTPEVIQPSETPVPEPPTPAPTTPAEEAATPICTCGAADGVHTEGCPLYQAPEVTDVTEETTHIEGCADGCTVEGCECTCHKTSLFDRLMACTTVEEFDKVVSEAAEEEFAALTEEENAIIQAHLEEIMPEPLPAIEVPEYEEPVESEIIYPTVSYANVAPFGSPVVGGEN